MRRCHRNPPLHHAEVSRANYNSRLTNVWGIANQNNKAISNVACACGLVSQHCQYLQEANKLANKKRKKRHAVLNSG